MNPKVRQYLLDIGIDPVTPGGKKVFDHLESVENFHIDLQPAWWDMHPDQKSETLYNYLVATSWPHTFNDSHTPQQRLSHLAETLAAAAKQGVTTISVSNPGLAADDLRSLLQK